LLVLAAMGLPRVSSDAVTTSLIAAESMLDRLPDNEEIPARLAAAQIRLALARRTGNFGLATAAAERAEALIDQLSQEVHDRYPGIRAQMLAGYGAADLWAGGWMRRRSGSRRPWPPLHLRGMNGPMAWGISRWQRRWRAG
jgi:hypothetical protein